MSYPLLCTLQRCKLFPTAWGKPWGVLHHLQMSQFESGLRTLILQTQTCPCAAELALHQYEIALPHCRMGCETGACPTTQKPARDCKAESKQDLGKDAHTVLLRRFASSLDGEKIRVHQLLWPVLEPELRKKEQLFCQAVTTSSFKP